MTTTSLAQTREASLGEAIRAARELQDITQQQLAELAKLPAAQTISDIERNVREVKAWELLRIAHALHTSIDVLLGVRHEEPTRVFWRRGSKGATRVREAQLLERARRYSDLEEWCEIPPRKTLPDLPLNPRAATYADALRIADELRPTLDLGSRPACSIRKVLEESFGVKVFYEQLEGDESAACSRGQFGAAILMNASHAPWRCNYSFAHELFHLVTWTQVTRELPSDPSDEPDWLESVEKLADKFASHLLLPADELLAQYDSRLQTGELEDVDYIELAREFDVSTSALLWRLVTLYRMSADDARRWLGDAEFQRKDRRTMAARWESHDEVFPERFRRLALVAYDKGRIGRARLADYLEVKIGELGHLDLDADGSDPATASTA